ncbi:MAG: alpha/beta hydrolase [Ferruginibacter sp.]|nr:alpha/beta hydrolase [Ferruginibacter sp.]
MKSHNRKKVKRILIRLSIFLLILTGICFLWFKLSPWPSTLLIRYAFNKEAEKVNKQLEKHVPENVRSIHDISYDAKDKDSKLDIHFPSSIENTQNTLPLIIWIHGGGLISGNKNQVENYCKILASKGFVVASIDYTIAPEAKYPKPVHQANASLAFLIKQASQYYIDTTKVVLAGDSGGSLIAAQTGNCIYNPQYATLLQLNPSIQKEHLVGMLLYCGIYNIDELNTKGEFAGFMRTVTWAYSGKKDFKQVPAMKTVSVTRYMDSTFAPCFISAGNGDPLLNQSLHLAKKLTEMNVYTDTLFFPQQQSPVLPHEYQFNLDSEAGQWALNRSLSFLRKVTTQ